MHVTVWLPGVLRQLSQGVGTLEFNIDEPATVGDLLDEVERAYPAVGRRIRDETGALRAHINVFVGDRNIRDRRGQSEPVTEGSEVSVIPAVSGG